MGKASALGYEQMTLRAFIFFAGVGNEEKCIAAPRYSRFTVDGDVLENGVEIHATAAFRLLDVESGGENCLSMCWGHCPFWGCSGG